MNSEKTTLEFEYNADGLRTQKVVTTTSDHVHSFQDTVHQPKCTENGYTTHTCICGYIYQDSPVPATGHDFTTTVVGTNCTEVGHTVYSCSCGYYYEDGSNGHDFATLVVEPSETVNGFTLHECECGYSYQSDPVASLAGASDTVDVISNTKVYDYVYNGSTLTQLTITTTIHGDGTTTEELYFAYDGSSPMAVIYNGTVYYYVTNLQGDVIAILDETGAAAVTYSYDAWGNILEIGGSMKDDLGVANPLTYRGYVFDTETSLYYLQSRYYNPEVGRFINADELLLAGNLLGYNMFTYCFNTPVYLQDSKGTQPTEAVDEDGDGTVDYYRYDYTYTRTIHFTYHGYSCDVTVTGSVYIFPDIGDPDGLTEADIPEGFDPAYDIMIGYYQDENNHVLYAYQAHLTSVVAHDAIIKVMQKYDDDFDTPWERTDRSLHIEWNSHNQFSPFSSTAQNIDFDNYEEGRGYIYFYWKAFRRGWDTWIVPLLNQGGQNGH